VEALVDAAHHLGGVLQPPGAVARVDPLRAVAQVEVDTGPQPALGLEDGAHHLGGGPRPGGRLQHHQAAGAQQAPHHGGRSLDGPQVGRTVGERGRHGDDRNVEVVQLDGARHRPVAAAVERGPHGGRGNVLHVGSTGCQRAGLVDIGVEPGDVEAGVDRRHRHGQPDIALADEQYLHGGVLCVLNAGC
jgi:hypothetical protein